MIRLATVCTPLLVPENFHTGLRELIGTMECSGNKKRAVEIAEGQA